MVLAPSTLLDAMINLRWKKYFAEARAGSRGLDESLTEPDFGNHSIVFNEVCFPSRVNLFY
jgi:hypothetical protein